MVANVANHRTTSNCSALLKFIVGFIVVVIILLGTIAGTNLIGASYSAGLEAGSEVAASLSISPLPPDVWLVTSEEAAEVVSEESAAVMSAGNGVCVPNPATGLCDHITKDGGQAKAESRINAAKQTIGKQFVQCLVRKGVEGVSANAVMLVFDVAFKGPVSGATYKGVSFIHNLDVPQRSTFASLKRLKDANMPGFETIDNTDPRCGASMQFMNALVQALVGY